MKRFLFVVSAALLITTNLFAQNQAPVAVPDSVSVLSEDTVVISVLQNDYDPDGNDFYIKTVLSPRHGKRSHNDSVIFYRSNYYYGGDSLKYRIQDNGNPPESSDYTYVYIDVLNNPNLPYAVNDTFTVMAQKTAILNLIRNDSDPNQDLLAIDTTLNIAAHGTISVTGDSSVTFTSSVDHIGKTSFYYRNIEKETVKHYFSNKVIAVINVTENSDLPVANLDEVDAMTFVPIEINITNNDYSPGGNSLKVYSVQETDNTTSEIISDSIVTIRTSLYSGADTLYYRVQEKNSQYNYISKQGMIVINPLPNPDVPVASDDYVTLYFADTISLNVLANDYSPTGEPIEIYDVSSDGNYYSINDSLIILANLKPPLSYEDSIHEITYYYRIREKNNPSIFSDWGVIHLTVKRNPQYPAGINDFAVAKGGFKIDVNLLENDLNPSQDSIILFGVSTLSNKNNSICKIINDSVVEYIPYADFSGIDTVKYYISLKDYYFPISYGYLIVNVQPSNFFGELDINNIKAGFNANGYLFNNYGFLGVEANYNGYHDYIPTFEAPKGSGLNAIFSGSLWIGGYSNNSGQDSSLHLAAVRYMQVGDDFWYGPVSDNYDEEYDNRWIGLWKLSKSDIAYHINHYNDWGYVPKAEISTWPGNGDESNGQMKQLAPFFDQNGNGIYEPMEGEYPLIRGDEAVYFIFNDARLPHGESQGKNLGVEIHGMAYAFYNPSDSALWNTVFVHYDIFNRSDTTYFNTYIGNFVDADIGNSRDDYILSDVQRGAMITYNGDDYDEDTELPNDGVFIKGYGDKLPAVAGVILGGPYMDKDGIDNPSGGCDESINGMNFGNNVADDERWGMEYFGYFNNGGYPITGDPSIAPEYYYLLHGFFKNGSRWSYNFIQDTLAFNYFFPGNSDTCNYGTGGIAPDFDNWTEEHNPYFGEPNPPGDRRGLLSTGPFTFYPGDKQVLDMAYVFARSYDGSDPVNIVKDRITDIRIKAVADSIIELPDTISGLNENHAASRAVNIFPNPLSEETINIDCRNIMENINFKIYNSSGIVITGGKLKPNKINSVILPNMKNGFYIIRLNTAKGFYYGKFIKQ